MLVPASITTTITSLLPWGRLWWQQFFNQGLTLRVVNEIIYKLATRKVLCGFQFAIFVNGDWPHDCNQICNPSTSISPMITTRFAFFYDYGPCDGWWC